MTLFWFTILIACIVLEGVYSSLEMAIVSFNKVRLHYTIETGSTRAKWMQ
ncbi:MAG: hypothetical protein KDK40_01910 [Chlamydiia bacterium]|nr:hypothetical protein [Chlamydiia bacterium]